MPTPSRIRFLIVRHGETDCNVQGIIQGQLDTDLNDVGRQQASLVGRALAAEHIDEVYSSPLKRARDTADAIVVAHPLFDVESSNGHADPDSRAIYWLDDRLKERGFGVLEGKQLDRSKPRRDSTQGIEKMSDFTARLASVLADVLLQPAPWSSSPEIGQTHPDGKDWVDEGGQTRLASLPSRRGPQNGIEKHGEETTSPRPQLNTGNCDRTIVLVAHGAAISALVGGVMLDSGLASLGAGVSRTRVWNCSITEIIFEYQGSALPQLTTKDGRQRADLVALLESSSEQRPFVIERWADVRHLPASLDDAVADKGSADEMVARQAS